MRLILIVAGTVLLGACKPPPENAPAPPKPPTPPPTPHPAQAAKQRAIELYPDLAKEDSNFNRAFRELFEHNKTSNPRALVRIDWPLDLAGETGRMLGVEPAVKVEATPVPAPPMPVRAAPSPNALSRGAYDQRRNVAATPALRRY